MHVVFLSHADSKIYLQTAKGFTGDVTGYPALEGGRRAAGMAKLAEYEVQVLMGIVAATSGLGLAAVLTSDIGRFTHENRTHFKKWLAIAAAARSAGHCLKLTAPARGIRTAPVPNRPL